MNPEMSLLEFIKKKLVHWFAKGPDIRLEDLADQPTLASEQSLRPATMAESDAMKEDSLAGSKKDHAPLPWKSIFALGLAIFAQLMLEPPARNILASVILYAAAAAMFIWAMLLNEVEDVRQEAINSGNMPTSIRWVYLLIALGFSLAAFLAFGGEKFTLINFTLWTVAIVYIILAFWTPDLTRITWRERWNTWRASGYVIKVTRSFLIALGITGVVVFFRFYDLTGTPGEMFSDHAEKLLDVADVMAGKTAIFFPRNTGREAIQFYLTAAIAQIFGTGLSFISLKLGTTLAGFLTLPFIYLLGKELGGKWVGWSAFLLAGIAYWPNVISRVGLRFPLYPLFAAPVLYFLIRGIRRSNRNDFIWAGLALGLGLHGYSPARILPFVVVAAIAIYLVHRHAASRRKETLIALVIVAVVAFVMFLPLFRYMLSDPEMFGYRAFSRLGSSERSLPGPAVVIFLQNLWRAVVMPFLSDGNIWVHSIPNRPALDVVSATLYFLGTLVVFVRYLRRRDWVDLFLILSVPLLMLPSILSLAFPEENPSLNRTGGAIIPVFILCAIAFVTIIQTMLLRWKGLFGRFTTIALGVILMASVLSSNYDLAFRQYKQQFLLGAWNTSEMGRAIRGFATSVGSPETAHVVPYPYWVDTRLVGINAGYPLKDYALWPSAFADTLNETRAQLFILNPSDTESLASLQMMYPNGVLTTYPSHIEGKEFLVFFVPGQTVGQP
jgi:hypothetical protein